MSDKQEIATLLKEMHNASAWIEKLSRDLCADPTNEMTRRLLYLTKELYDRRVRMLAEMGVDTEDHGS